MTAGLISAGDRIDKYEIVEKLGEGGFGTVYKARHSITKLDVAIKVLATNASRMQASIEARFRREASIGNTIGHENIVRALDFGEYEGQPYIVMEYLSGVALADLIQEAGSLPVQRAAGMFVQMCSALEAAHRHQVIHRDLKPENIFLISQAGRRDFVKVLDFGIAKMTGDTPDSVQTQTDALIGSPRTMSPEQCRGSVIDHRSDIYSLGVVLFYALSGRYPFEGTQADILSAHLRDVAPPLSSIKAGLPPTLEAIVARMLAKQAKDRFASMAELGQALRPFRGGSGSFRIEDSLDTERSPVPGDTHRSPAPADRSAISMVNGEVRSTVQSGRTSRRRVFALAGLAVLGVLGVGAYYFWSQAITTAPPKEAAALPVTTTPVVAPPPPAPELYRLFVDVDPADAEVAINQIRQTGVPPFVTRGVSGAHFVVSATKSGYTPLEQEVNLESSDQRIRFQLEAEAPAPAELPAPTKPERGRHSKDKNRHQKLDGVELMHAY